MKKFLLVMVIGVTLHIAIKASYGAEANMPIKVNIVQCGSKEQLLDSCQNVDPRCCSLIEPAAGDVRDQRQQASYTYEVIDYEWTEAPIDAERKILNLE